MALMNKSKHTTSGTVITGKAAFGGLLIGTDGANDPVVTVYDNTSNSGTELIPTTTFDASALGLNGAMIPHPIHCSTGIYVEITTGGTVEVTILFRQI